VADQAASRDKIDGGRNDQRSLGPSRTVARLGRGVTSLLAAMVGLLALWQAIVLVLAPPPYMLPSPAAVARAMVDNADRLATDTAVTLVEIAAGLLAGVCVGIAAGLAMAASPLVGRVLAPVLVVSQALPVFAIAPLLVLWFGFGLASKVVMAAIIIFFPVASALADGLRRTDPGLLDLAALSGTGRLRTLALIRLPAALPSLATGIRVGAVFAPIGAVIGEWVGASHGLGLVMIEANARMKTDLMFAALAILAVTVLVLRAVVDHLTRRMIPWVEDPG
jgi:putative hydroxymethylpyrimidine transport system permease protein